MNTQNRKLGPELFYIDENGKKADASLHEEMLAGTPKQRMDRLKRTRAFAKKMGLSQEAINSLYRYRGNGG